MIRYCFTLALTACLLGCGAASPPPPAPAPDTSAETPAVSPDALEMSGIKLYLYAAAAVPGLERSPAFSVEADGFSQDETKTWRFTNARATVHPQNTGDEAIIFNAATGQLREEESALLEGGVTAKVGDMTLSMESVDWRQGTEQSDSVASSDQPVTVLDSTMELYAQQFRLYPNDSSFVLFEVHGEVAFQPPQSGEPPALPEGEPAAS